MKVLTWSVRAALAAVFVGAALSKIADPAGFAAAIRTYRLLPPWAVAGLALWLPWLELCSGLAVFSPRHRGAAGGLLAAACALFLAAIAQAWVRGLDLNCGCFGGPATIRGVDYLWLFARDLALLAAAGWLCHREWRAQRSARQDLT